MELDLDTTIGFLQTLRPAGPWNLTAIVPDGPVHSATFSEPDKTRAWLKKHANANLYFVINPASKPTGSGGRVNRIDLDHIEFLHADIDRFVGRSKDSVAEQLDATMIIDSGGGLAALWRLDEPMPVTPENREWAEGANRWLVEQHDGDRQATDISRLLRLPGTINYPNARKKARGRTVVPTRLLSQTGELHPRSAFGQAARPASSGVADKDIDVSVIEEVDDLDALVAQYGLSERVRNIILDGRAPGEEKPNDDSRDQWMFDGCCQMVRAGVPVGVVAGVLLNREWAISGHILDHTGRPTDVYAMRQALRAEALVQAEQQADVEALRAGVSVGRDTEPATTRPLSQDEERIGRLTLVHADRVEMKPLNPLWPGRIYVGKLTTLAGVPDQGKSMVTCDIAARVSRGLAWPDGSGFAPKGTAIFLAAEDDKADTIVPRLAAAGADLTKVKILNSLVISHRDKKVQRTFNIAEDIAELTTLVRRYPDTRVLFIDPTNAFMGTSKENDSFRDSDVRAVLGPLKEWAEEHEVAVVLVTHFKKGGTGRALDQVMGSLAFVALARSSWAFLEEKDAEGEPTGRKLLAKIKQNITAPVDALACHIEGVKLSNGLTAPKIVWEDAVEGNADMIMSGGAGGQKLAAAKAFLLGTLADGPVKASEVRAEAERSGISEKTLNRAKKVMGIESVQRDGAWYWEVGETEMPAM